MRFSVKGAASGVSGAGAETALQLVGVEIRIPGSRDLVRNTTDSIAPAGFGLAMNGAVSNGPYPASRRAGRSRPRFSQLGDDLRSGGERGDRKARMERHLGRLPGAAQY